MQMQNTQKSEGGDPNGQRKVLCLYFTCLSIKWELFVYIILLSHCLHNLKLDLLQKPSQLKHRGDLLCLIM